MTKRVLLAIVSFFLLSTPLFANSIDEQVQEFMDKIYIFQGFSYADKTLLHAAETQQKIKTLRAQIEAFSDTLIEDGSLNKAELLRVEDQVAQCILALDELSKSSD